MKYLSQRDPLWSTNHLGGSTLTVGRYGCTTTCISMLSDYFKCYKSPGEIAGDVNWYTPDGLILWQKLSFSNFGFVLREHGENKEHIIEYMKDPRKAVILQVDNGQHWVVALRLSLLRNDYVVLDPWTGKKCNAKAVYKNVTGAAYFTAK